MTTRTMTVAQALVEFLARQWTVDDDHCERTVAGVFGILGHGNLAGIGQAVQQFAADDPGVLPFRQGHNEQAMVHQAVGWARTRRRRSTWAVTASVGPGAANMLTGAALATANRLPALLLVSDTFAARAADPVLQQLEHPHDPGLQVSAAFAPLSRFFGRIDRGEQLFSVALAALRVLTDPVETGAVTLVLPEDVQTEAIDVPAEFLAPRRWHVRRPLPEAGPLERAVAAIRSARRPLLIAGGGVYYAGAEAALRDLVEATGIPVATTQSGGGALAGDHPLSMGGIGVTGTAAANRLAADADVVIGVGTRYSDFTTASGSLFDDRVRFVNLNVAPSDAFKHTQLAIVADAREGLRALYRALDGYRVDDSLRRAAAAVRADWSQVCAAATAPAEADLPGQSEILGAVADTVDPADVVVAAAGSLPGDLQKLWRPREPLSYHVEYGFSCMGYEIAGGLGVRRALRAADDHRDVVVLVGDGSYLMLHSELATAVAEGLKLIVVLIQNHGYASIGSLSETVGGQRFGTADPAAVDLAANARSYGCTVVDVAPGAQVLTELRAAVTAAKARTETTVIQVRSDPRRAAPDSGAWWEVPVAEVSEQAATWAARREYEQRRTAQRPLCGTGEADD